MGEKCHLDRISAFLFLIPSICTPFTSNAYTAAMKVIFRIHVSMKTSFDFPVLRISTEDELSQLICILFPFQYFPHILHAMSTVNSSNAFICNSWTDMNCGKTVWKK